MNPVHDKAVAEINHIISVHKELVEALRMTRANLAGFMNEFPHGNGPIVALAWADSTLKKVEEGPK